MIKDSFFVRLLKKKDEVVYNIPYAMQEDLKKIDCYKQAARFAVVGTPAYYHVAFMMWDNRKR